MEEAVEEDGAVAHGGEIGVGGVGGAGERRRGLAVAEVANEDEAAADEAVDELQLREGGGGGGVEGG